MKTELKIEGMSCGHCVSSVKSALEAVPGVEKAEVNLVEGRATVEHGAETSAEALAEAVKEEGYAARAA